MNHIAIDHYGQTYHNLGAHPRKALLKRLDRKTANKIYIDQKNEVYHIGWVIAGLWCTVYQITPMQIKQ